MLLTVEQAAERLGTSVRFVRRLRTEHRIPVIKLGRHIRIDSTDLEQFIAAGRQEARHEPSPGANRHRRQPA